MKAVQGASSNRAEFVRWLSRHFCILSWLLERDDAGASPTQYALNASAFVVTIDGCPFLITAGHIIARLLDFLDEGLSIKKAGVLDDLHNAGRHKTIVPFYPDPEEWIVLEKDEEGFDYAALPLRPYYAQVFTANGVVPISNIAWDELPNTIEFFGALGIPEELTRADFDGEGPRMSGFTTTPTLLHMTPNGDPPACLKTPFLRLYLDVSLYAGHFSNEPRFLSRLDGMSGGPVFGFAKDDQDHYRYWLIGLQSGWHPKSRVAAVCPTRQFFNWLRTQLGQEI